MELPVVILKRVSDIRNYEAIQDGIKALLDKFKKKVTMPDKATVIIKVNLCMLMGSETGATVDPRVARAIVEWLKSSYNIERIIIAEADATHLSADMAFKALGWRKYFREWHPDVELLNLSDDKRVQTKTCFGTEIEMSEKYMNADIMISLAKLKTHSLQKMTCTMKNLFGALPEKYKIRYHHRLTDAICEFASARRPDLSVVDGLIGMDGKGPINGFPKVCRLLIAGNDMIATEYSCARLMGFKPKSIPHVAKALKLGLGSSRYHFEGDILENNHLDFKLMPLWEELFRKLIKGIREKKTARPYEKTGSHISDV